MIFPPFSVQGIDYSPINVQYLHRRHNPGDPRLAATPYLSALPLFFFFHFTPNPATRVSHFFLAPSSLRLPVAIQNHPLPLNRSVAFQERLFVRVSFCTPSDPFPPFSLLRCNGMTRPSQCLGKASPFLRVSSSVLPYPLIRHPLIFDWPPGLPKSLCVPFVSPQLSNTTISRTAFQLPAHAPTAPNESSCLVSRLFPRPFSDSGKNMLPFVVSSPVPGPRPLGICCFYGSTSGIPFLLCLLFALTSLVFFFPVLLRKALLAWAAYSSYI